jgi:hypothetical protein
LLADLVERNECSVIYCAIKGGGVLLGVIEPQPDSTRKGPESAT